MVCATALVAHVCPDGDGPTVREDIKLEELRKTLTGVRERRRQLKAGGE